MSDRLTRRAFLSRRAGAERTPPLRPPWALAEADFTAACSRCRQCIDACPENVLLVGDGGFPGVDFSAGECTFCRRCAAACPEPAFREAAADAPAWRALANIADRCIGYQGIVCQSCREICERRAIRFPRGAGGAPVPQIDGQQCSGCGACVSVCPVGAIAVTAARGTGADAAATT